MAALKFVGNYGWRCDDETAGLPCHCLKLQYAKVLQENYLYFLWRKCRLDNRSFLNSHCCHQYIAQYCQWPVQTEKECFSRQILLVKRILHSDYFDCLRIKYFAMNATVSMGRLMEWEGSICDGYTHWEKVQSDKPVPGVPVPWFIWEKSSSLHGDFVISTKTGQKDIAHPLGPSTGQSRVMVWQIS